MISLTPVNEFSHVLLGSCTTGELRKSRGVFGVKREDDEVADKCCGCIKTKRFGTAEISPVVERFASSYVRFCTGDAMSSSDSGSGSRRLRGDAADAVINCADFFNTLGTFGPLGVFGGFGSFGGFGGFGDLCAFASAADTLTRI